MILPCDYIPTVIYNYSIRLSTILSSLAVADFTSIFASFLGESSNFNISKGLFSVPYVNY